MNRSLSGLVYPPSKRRHCGLDGSCGNTTLAQPILGYSPTQMTLVTRAVAFGGLGRSHINDSGFWIVTKHLGLSVKDGLKTWTVLTTILGVVGFLLTWGVFALVS